MKFTEEDDKYLIENHKDKLVPQMAKEINRRDVSINKRLAKLGLPKKYRNIKYTKEEDLFILENLSLKRADIAQKLNRSVQSLQNRITFLSKVKMWDLE